jgi:hypothetical protein
VTPVELAAELGVNAKALRRWLRQTWPRAEPGGLWVLTAEQVDGARARFADGTSRMMGDAGTATVGVLRLPPGGEAPNVGADEDVEALADWSLWEPLLVAAPTAPQLPGVYMVRQGDEGAVVYVGMAGERRGEGIRGRLRIYTSGKGMTSGLGEAVADRALADASFVRARLAEIEAGHPRRAKQWAAQAVADADLSVRWAVTADRAAAAVLERRIMRALPRADLWNRYL